MLTQLKRFRFHLGRQALPPLTRFQTSLGLVGGACRRSCTTKPDSGRTRPGTTTSRGAAIPQSPLQTQPQNQTHSSTPSATAASSPNSKQLAWKPPPSFHKFPTNLSYGRFQIDVCIFKLLNRGFALDEVDAALIKEHFPHMPSFQKIHKHYFLRRFRSGKYKLSWFMAVDEEITPESLDQFIEWERTAVDTPPADQVLWTLEESLRLVEAVEKYGTASWNVIAAHIKTKTAEACRSRKQRLDEWTHPSPPLTEAFMEELDQRMRQFNSDWDQVKAFYPDRGDSARLRQQYWAWRQRVRLPHNRVWSNADVDCLRVAVAQLGYHRWLDVADRVGTKSAEQCKTKWHKLADPPSSIVTVTATATATDTTVAALRPPAIDEYVHLLFYLAVYHPHKIRSALPSILEWLPAPYQCHALAPEVDIHWKRVSRWLPTPNTELRLKRIVQKVPKLLGTFGQMTPAKQASLRDLRTTEQGLQQAQWLKARNLKTNVRNVRLQIQSVLLVDAFKQLLRNPPPLPSDK